MGESNIACPSCGASNEVTALDCAACGESLLSTETETWKEERQRHLEARERAERELERTAQRRVLRFFITVGVILLLLAAWGVVWLSRNVYLGGEPQYDGRAAAQWVEVLESEDHFMRRRAALALESLAERINERTALEVAPGIAAALDDEDETVRERLGRALATIESRTGVGRPSPPPPQ